MARVFLDTNYFIGLANRTPETDTEILNNHQGFISVLSCHVLFYVNKIKVPNTETESFIDGFNLTSFTLDTLKRALQGPTDDLEDNIQLHSAAESDCAYFLSFDKKLLKLGFFGKTQLVQSLPTTH